MRPAGAIFALLVASARAVESAELALTGATIYPESHGPSISENPARRFGFAGRKGRLEAGMDADVTVLKADPARHVTAFSKIRYMIREGRLIYSAR